MIQPGTLIGDRYQIESLVDEGGMARVYRVVDVRLNRVLALKIIRQESFSPYVLEEVFGRFDLEASALAKLSHPNIVQIIDFGKHEGVPYVVMPYVEGGTLKKFQGQPLTIERAARLLLPITRALSYAHSHGFVHRDVKPSNILLTESEEPMLSDFGLVKQVDSKVAQALTATGASIGTPEYMAPEQAIGDKVDGRADIYSLGVVFYELVTGDRPFKADTPIAIVLQQATGQTPDPRKANPGLSDRAVEVIKKAMAGKAADRFQTMNEFESALEELRGAPSRPIPSAPPPAYDVEKTMITPSKAVSAPKPPPTAPAPPPPASMSDENNATMQMPPLRPASVVPPPPNAVENLPTMQMSKPVTQPRETTPPPGMQDMPTMQVGARTPAGQPQPGFEDMPTMQVGVNQARIQAPPPADIGSMQTMAVPTIPPPIPPTAQGSTGNKKNRNMVLIAVLGGGSILIVLLAIGAFWLFSRNNKPEKSVVIAPTGTEAQIREATNTPMPTNTPTELPTATLEPTATALPVVSIFKNGSEMILIPAGSFFMGCDPGNPKNTCSESEMPMHEVNLPEFYIDKYEVTNGAYQYCVQAGACKPPKVLSSHLVSDYYNNEKFLNAPVINVTWNDAAKFCQWRGVRLPTEAEWEKAARGNIDQRIFTWGDSDPNCDLVNYNPGTACVGDTIIVGYRGGNVSLFGVMDMAGNVQEWVQDLYGADYYQNSPSEAPPGPEIGKTRVVRGGSWSDGWEQLQVFNRENFPANTSSESIGFRCAWSP